MEKKYFEVLFYDKHGEYGICIVGKRKPSTEEAAIFLKEDMEKLHYTAKNITEINELSKAEAYAFYDMENEHLFPVFGLTTVIS